MDIKTEEQQSLIVQEVEDSIKDFEVILSAEEIINEYLYKLSLGEEEDRGDENKVSVDEGLNETDTTKDLLIKRDENKNPKVLNEDDLLNIHIVDISDQTKRRAHDNAREQLTEEKNKLTGVGGIAKKLGRYGYFEGTTYQRYKKQALIEELLKDTDGKTAERFEAGSIRTERNTEISVKAAESEEEKTLKELIISMAKGEIEESEYIELKRKLISELFISSSLKESKNTDFEKFEDNIDKYIDQIKVLIDHGKTVEDIRDLITLNLGIAKDLSITRVEYSKTDKVLEGLKRHKIAGKLVNETVFATGGSVLGRVAFSIASSRAATIASFGGAAVVSSLLSAAKEKQRIKRDRQMQIRDYSAGRSNGLEGKRREQLQRTVYDLMPIKDSFNDLVESFDKFNKSIEGDKISFEKMLKIIGEYRARRIVSLASDIDLFIYSSSENMQEEFSDLDWYVRYVQSKMQISENQDKIKSILGVDDIDIEGLIGEQIEESVKNIEEDISQKDSIFRGVKSARIGRYVAWNLVTGLTIGALGQGVVRELMEKHEELLKNGVIKQDFLEGLLNKWNQVKIKKTTYMHSPKIALRSKGRVGEIFMNGKKIQEVKLNKNGSLTSSSIQTLQQKGIGVKTSTVYTSSGGEVMRNNSIVAGNTNVQRNLWYDNNNAQGVYTKNELGIWWGSNTGYNSKGDVVFNIASMTNKGSYQGNSSVAIQNLIEEGKMKIWITASRSTQNKAYVFNVNRNGLVNIDKNSLAYRLFSKSSTGHVKFNGAFVEAVVPQATTKLGTHIGDPVATYVGSNTANPIINKETITTLFEKPTRYIKPKTQIGWPWFIPVVGRTPLEKAEINSNQENSEIPGNSLAKSREVNDFNLIGDIGSINSSTDEDIRGLFNELYINDKEESKVSRVTKREQARYAISMIKDYFKVMSAEEIKLLNEYLKKRKMNKDKYENERKDLFSENFLLQEYDTFKSRFENDEAFRLDVLRKWAEVHLYYINNKGSI